jgi:hypothetical protein
MATEWQKELWLKNIETKREPCPFYVIPKLYKEKLSSRPITAQQYYVLATMSIALSKVFQIQMEHIAELAKDSKTVIRQLERLLSQGATLTGRSFYVTNPYFCKQYSA